MRRDSRPLGAAVALVGLAVLFGSAVSPSTAASEREPKIFYAEFAENPDDASEYRLKMGAIRTKSAEVRLTESPKEGRTRGRTETVRLSKAGGTGRPRRWIGYTSRSRSAPCYRVAYVARNPHGRDSKVYRLCAFGHDTDATLRLAPW